MHGNYYKLSALLLCAALLAGCGAPLLGGNVEEQLRAPQPGARQSAVQRALNSYLGETLQLKYPRGGTEPSPMLFLDLDEDGTEEAVVLYLAQNKSQNVHMAVLEEREDGWEVAHEVEGLSTEVASVQMAHLTGEGTQLVVGYANATLSDAYLSVYDYQAEGVVRLFEQSYTQFLVANLDDDGPEELLVVPQSTAPGALSLQLVRPGEEGLRVVQSLALDERFVNCKALQLSVSPPRRGVVVDGTFTVGGMASQVLRLTEGGTLVEWPALNGLDVTRRSLRYLTELPATRLDATRAVYVPTAVAATATLSSSRRFYFVTWQDFLSGDPERFLEEGLPAGARYGLYDASYNFFLRLPDSWRDEVKLMDGSVAGDWQLRTKTGNALLIGVRVTDGTRPAGLYTNVATLGEQTLQIYFTDQCPVDSARIIRAGVHVF